MYVDSKHIFFHLGSQVLVMWALPAGAKWQCNNTCGPAYMVHLKVIPQYPFMTLILNPLG